MVVKAVEHDEYDLDTRGHPAETFVGKGVGLQLSVVEGTNGILHLLVATVQRRQVQIRRCLGYINVPMIGPEKILSAQDKG